MTFEALPLEGAYKIDLNKIQDDRGFFARFYCSKELSEIGLSKPLCQINNSYNKRAGTLRGLHSQKNPKAEVKIVRCIQGAIWDVIVDIRPDSPSFGKWTGLELTAENRLMMFVPEGFAHGFISLTDNSEIIYLVSEFYSPEDERTIRWDEPFVDIKWPIKPLEISEKDASAKFMAEMDEFKMIIEKNV